MPISISKIVQALEPSATLAMAAKAKELKAAGKKVYDFSVGEPDGETWTQVIALADHAVYIAKRGGRNRAVGIAPRGTSSLRATGAITTAMVSHWLDDGTLQLEEDAARGSVAEPTPINQRVVR